MNENRSAGLVRWTQLLLLTLLALFVHALVLKFIFPGYYSPLYPYHSDFYLAEALANVPKNGVVPHYIGAARPVGTFFCRLTGYLGVYGAITFTIVNVAVNTALTALLLQRILKPKFDYRFLLLYCVYCFLLFSQSWFYTFYTQDVMAHLAYFFLLAGICCFYKYYWSRIVLAYCLLFFFCVISLLNKETYGLSAIALAGVWFLYDYKKESLVKALMPLVVTGVALLLIVGYNTKVDSVFVNFKHAENDPYFVNTSPISIGNELRTYALEGPNLLLWAVLAIIGVLSIMFLGRTRKEFLYIYFGCLLATLAAWLPNALIPNHHNGGYAFNGACLTYLPVFFLPALGQQLRKFAPYIVALLVAACLVSPVFNKKEYDKQGWTLMQEESQRQFLPALVDCLKSLPPAPQKRNNVLITGLTITFYPFHHPLSLKSFGNAHLAKYNVVNPALTVTTPWDDSVRFMTPGDVNIQEYDVVWMFKPNGALLGRMPLDAAAKNTILKDSARDLIINPDSTKLERLSQLLK